MPVAGLEAADALLGRGVRGEHLAEASPATAAAGLGLERVDDVVRGLARVHTRRDPLRVHLQALQRLGQGTAVADQLGRRRIGLELPAAADSGLDHGSRDRGQDGQGQLAEGIAVAVAAAAREHRPPHGDMGDERHRHADGRGHRADQDVAVADVGQLMGQHPADLVPAHRLGEPRGDAHRGVLGVAAGGEGVGLRIGRHVQLRHRHVRPGAQLGHDPVVLGHLGRAHRLGPGRGDGQLGAEPVGAPRQHQGEDQADHQAARTEIPADHNAQAAEQGQQRERLGRVEHGPSPSRPPPGRSPNYGPAGVNAQRGEVCSRPAPGIGHQAFGQSYRS